MPHRAGIKAELIKPGLWNGDFERSGILAEIAFGMEILRAVDAWRPRSPFRLDGFCSFIVFEQFAGHLDRQFLAGGKTALEMRGRAGIIPAHRAFLESDLLSDRPDAGTRVNGMRRE